MAEMRELSSAPSITHCIIALCALQLSGCDAWRQLRAYLRGDEATPLLGNASIRVDVEPADGITILLDDIRRANLSPWVGRNLAAGPHVLEVRSMGYHSLRMHVVLIDGETITVPVALRPRPEATPIPRPAQARTPRPQVPEAPQPIAPEVPPGVDRITLTILLRPPVPILLDNIPVRGRSVTLKRVTGHLQLGDSRLDYRLGGRGLLFLTPADDGALWTLNGASIVAGSSFKHNKGVAQLERRDPSGGVLTALIRR